MPYSPKAHRLFEAVAHDPALAKRKGIPQAKAAQMASEGVKPGKSAAIGKGLINRKKR